MPAGTARDRIRSIRATATPGEAILIQASLQTIHADVRRRVWLGALSLGLAMTSALAATPVGAQGLPDFTELVEKVGPAVVGIRTTERAKAARAGSETDDEMLEFFRRFGIPMPNQRPNPSPTPNPRTPQQPGPNGGADGEPQTRGVGSAS